MYPLCTRATLLQLDRSTIYWNWTRNIILTYIIVLSSHVAPNLYVFVMVYLHLTFILAGCCIDNACYLTISIYFNLSYLSERGRFGSIKLIWLNHFIFYGEPKCVLGGIMFLDFHIGVWSRFDGVLFWLPFIWEIIVGIPHYSFLSVAIYFTRATWIRFR